MGAQAHDAISTRLHYTGRVGTTVPPCFPPMAGGTTARATLERSTGVLPWNSGLVAWLGLGGLELEETPLAWPFIAQQGSRAV